MALVETKAPHRRLSGKALEVVYRVGVVIKGIDGFLEVVAAFLLLFAPGVLHSVLRPLAVELGESSHPIQNLAGYWAGTLDHEIMVGTHVVLISFLIAHGTVKVVLAYCLFREFAWVYPYAVVVLGVFVAYEAYTVIRNPSIAVGLFMLLDLLILWLVWREWRQLRSEAKDAASGSAQPAQADVKTS
jgi:uncharacterized membrane protein